MQAGTLDSVHSVEFGQKSKPGASTVPVVGASQATPTAASATGAQVELASLAVSLATATSAGGEVRNSESVNQTTRTAKEELPAPDSKSLAASLQLSPEAQRLALIPAQVMDADEVAAARAEVEKAQEKLAEMRSEANKRSEEAIVVESNQRANQKVESPRNDTENAAASLTASAATIEGRSKAPESVTSAGVDSRNLSVGSPKRPDQSTLIHGKSPFESSSPGATGQSVDIVVGDPAPAAE